MKPSIEAVIEDVIVEPSRIQPIIVNFQNGELKDEEAKKMSCGLFYDQERHNSLLGLSNGQIVYKGYRPDSSKELMRTMLVLHNKKTGKVRLVQVERWQVSPVLQKVTLSDSTNTVDDKIALLNKEFGSKKVKRKTEQYERMKINFDSVKDQLEKTVSNVEVDRLDLSTQIDNNDFITNTTLPECNRDAINAEDVYNTYDIIPKNKLELLAEQAIEISSDEDSLTGKSKFFSLALANLKSQPKKKKKIAILLYIQAVTNWLNMPMKDAKKRGIEICAASEEVNSYIIDTYSVQSAHGRLRPNSIKDKGVIHCMILALIISNFTLDLELFATVFSHRIGLKKLTDLAKIVGALPNKENKKIITLKVPLPERISLVKKNKKKS